MKAIILAAGYATRLYPITQNFSKALLPIDGKPIISYIAESLYKVKEIDEIFVVTNELFYENFLDWKALYNFDKVKIINDHTNSNETKLGAIGDIKYVIDDQNIDEETLIITGDTFFEFKMTDFVDCYKKNKISTTCVKKETVKDLSRFGIAELEDNIIVGFEEKPAHPKSNNVVYACYLYNKEDLKLINEYLKTGNSPDAPGNYIAWLCKKSKIQAFILDGYCIDIGTHESYAEAKNINKE